MGSKNGQEFKAAQQMPRFGDANAPYVLRSSQYNDKEKQLIQQEIDNFEGEYKVAKMASSKNLMKNEEVGQTTNGVSHSHDIDMRKILINAKELASLEVLGKGSYGEVVKGKYRGTFVAVKTLHHVDKEALREFRSEIIILSGLRHSNIVMLVGAVWEMR
jgi:hypothetical protein